jgi:hypothetical protein
MSWSASDEKLDRSIEEWAFRCRDTQATTVLSFSRMQVSAGRNILRGEVHDVPLRCMMVREDVVFE